MQHGSLPLVGDIARITRYLLDTPSPEAVREHAMTLEDATGRAVSWRAAAEVWAGAFADHLGLDLTEDALSVEESFAADALLREKYGETGWTRRR
jgi:lipoate-protein ligase A